MNENKKRIIMLALILVTIISVSVIGTYAYFLTSAGRNEEQKLTVMTGTLSLVFEDNDEGLTDQIMLGESRSKEFRIRNTGTEQVTTNMLWSGLVNTYLEESLSYTLEYKTAEEGTWQPVTTTSHANIPQSERTSDYNLATGLTIPSGATYYYKLTITFNNLPDVNQEADKTAILSTKFKLGDTVLEASGEKTLAYLKLTAKEGNPTFASAATIDETSTGLYSLEDDYGISYYYRGAVENNYVKFGGFYWRIIRINGDGSIRMIYDGTQAWPNGNGASIFTTSETDRFTSTNKMWNSNYYNDAKYTGWMYGGTYGSESKSKSQAQKNDTDSKLKEIVDNWYNENLVKNLANGNRDLTKYLGDEIFCNDRTTPGSSTTGWSGDTGKGFGTNGTAYGATARIGRWNSDTSKVWPIFTCEQKNDAFTVSETEKGNGKQTYPVGLITADEIVAAGSGKYGTPNRYYYLYKTSNYCYWSFSPSYYSNGHNTVLNVDNDGRLYGYEITNYDINGFTGGIAPVINISPEYAATLTGTGIATNPYKIPNIE